MEKRSRPKEMIVMDMNPANQMPHVLIFSRVPLCFAKRSWAIFWKNSPNVVNSDEHTTVKMASALMPSVCGTSPSPQMDELVPLVEALIVVKAPEDADVAEVAGFTAGVVSMGSGSADVSAADAVVNGGDGEGTTGNTLATEEEVVVLSGSVSPAAVVHVGDEDGATGIPLVAEGVVVLWSDAAAVVNADDGDGTAVTVEATEIVVLSPSVSAAPTLPANDRQCSKNKQQTGAATSATGASRKRPMVVTGLASQSMRPHRKKVVAACEANRSAEEVC
jgi:hypothetical protein